MKSTRRVLTLLSVVLLVFIILSALLFIQKEWANIVTNRTAVNSTASALPSPLPPSLTATTPALPTTITVNGQQWGKSTCFIGATEGSSRFSLTDLEDLGVNAYHMYGGMSRWETQDDSSVYGYPTIAQIKANPAVINWNGGILS